jgi:hypothetical protein
MVSEHYGDGRKEKIEQPRETIEDYEIPLFEIYNTIHR